MFVLVGLGCANSEHLRLRTALLHADISPSSSADHPTDYQIGPGDVLAIRFGNKPDWNGAYAVLPHGCILLPQVGALPVSGHTADEVAELIRDRLGESAGLVFVELEHYQSQPIYLVGEIPGGSRAIAYQGPETIVQVLRRVGGLTPDADPTVIRVHRPLADNGQEEVLQVNLLAVLLEKDRQQNIYIRPYDRIVVPRNSWACLRDCLPRSWSHFLGWWSGNQKGRDVTSKP